MHSNNLELINASHSFENRKQNQNTVLVSLNHSFQQGTLWQQNAVFSSVEWYPKTLHYLWGTPWYK